ncbi:hypothetical protein BGZ63DRAFT_26142 [Mariannaea sp. PMI_226]|nr:hypothetical protein BGZ63DRAFT_26142 [Mariannaea sp. PMI_226]
MSSTVSALSPNHLHRFSSSSPSSSSTTATNSWLVSLLWVLWFPLAESFLLAFCSLGACGPWLEPCHPSRDLTSTDFYLETG